MGVVVGRPLGTNTIENVHVENPNDTKFIQTGSFNYVAGGITAGYHETTGTRTFTIKNSSVNNLIVEGVGAGSSVLGGMVGLYGANIAIENSYVTGSITVDTLGTIGGMLGNIRGAKTLTVKDSYAAVDIKAGTKTTGANIGLIVGSNQGTVNLTRVWVQSSANDTKLVDNGDASSMTRVYSNVTRGGAVLFLLTGTTLPTGFDSNVWERSTGKRPTLKNNSE